MTAHGSLEITIEAIKRGAFYYIEKPFAFEQILFLAERALQFKAIKPESRLRKSTRAQERENFGIVGNIGIAAANAAEQQVKKIGRSVGAKQAYTPDKFDAKRIVNDLKNSGAKTIFFFGSGKEQSALLSEAEAVDWRPHFFFLGVLTGRDLPTLTPAFKNKIFIAFPTMPADITSEGVAEFRALHEKYKFMPRHTASQLAAFAAAKVFVAALTRAGKDLSREKLITALEGLYDFDTGLTPRITFGPNRRVGAAGAHIIRIDLAEKEFTTASGWIKAYE